MQLPADLPTECPFQVTWRAAAFAVHAADGINLSTIKDAFRQLHVLSHVSLADLAARLDPADALSAEVAAAAAAAATAAADGQQHAAAATMEGARCALHWSVSPTAMLSAAQPGHAHVQVQFLIHRRRCTSCHVL